MSTRLHLKILRAGWSSTRSAGPALDKQTYADLVKPSKAVAPFTYQSISPGLFAGILSAETQSDEGPVCLIPNP